MGLIGLTFRNPSPSKGKGQALILSVQGSLNRSEFFSQTGAKVRNSPRVIVRQKNLQAVFSSVLFRLFGHRTFVPVEESFAEASAALPQIAPVPLSFSGLPDFSAPARKTMTSVRKVNRKCLHIKALHDPRWRRGDAMDVQV